MWVYLGQSMLCVLLAMILGHFIGGAVRSGGERKEVTRR